MFCSTLDHKDYTTVCFYWLTLHASWFAEASSILQSSITNQLPSGCESRKRLQQDALKKPLEEDEEETQEAPASLAEETSVDAAVASVTSPFQTLSMGSLKRRTHEIKPKETFHLARQDNFLVMPTLAVSLSVKVVQPHRGA